MTRYFALVLIAAACAGGEPYQVVEFVPPADGLTLGERGAGLVLVEFGDHLCPACQSFADSLLPRVRDRYIESALVEYRYMEAGPPGRDGVAAAVECLAIAVGFLEARKRVYEVVTVQGPRGLMEGESDCVQSAERASRRSEERRIARDLVVPGTPTFVLGRHRPDGRIVGWAIVGVPPRDSMLSLIDLAAERSDIRRR